MKGQGSLSQVMEVCCCYTSLPRVKTILWALVHHTGIGERLRSFKIFVNLIQKLSLIIFEYHQDWIIQSVYFYYYLNWWYSHMLYSCIKNKKYKRCLLKDSFPSLPFIKPSLSVWEVTTIIDLLSYQIYFLMQSKYPFSVSLSPPTLVYYDKPFTFYQDNLEIFPY